MTISTVQSPVLIHTIRDLRAWRATATREGQAVGFVPTMGALHDGHLHLLRTARKQCDRVVLSIFVNPAQFAPHEDLATYPRTLDADLALLARSAPTHGPGADPMAAFRPLADVVFAPNPAEMYPAGISTDVREQRGTFVEVLGVSHQMEGVTRPHFFRGVATIVLKLFNAVQPDRAYFGQKDVQQCVVLRNMVRDLLLPLTVVTVPTVRSATGLALSSRNRYLTPDQMEPALTLRRALVAASERYEAGERRRTHLLKAAHAVFATEPRAQLEYISLAHPVTLAELDVVGQDGAILSGAFRVGTTRLIDNILLGCAL
ncbi:pantoate-beta-alanine ligase [Tieghemiomyces parasiticus]|uniref:Pantoate--beta-alanine ligase n=1 Tax=Tieghemiomyces parasiticus TaxID=78921 RepID=A0A9W8DSR9_9FUNG|nr:pantoate-beta-alanine ligase [Tieghemiomyces parasiticus]